MYNFDEVIDRRHYRSAKWDLKDNEDVIPMWVADMDFKAAPAIIKALEKRISHGIFGYTNTPDEYYKALSSWFSRKHNLIFKKDHVILVPAVVPAISAIIKAMTKKGDSVLIQSPVYNLFFSSIKNNECNLVDCPLVYEDNTYHIDFDAFEKSIVDNNVKVFLLCNPHNPAGRVYTKEELERLGDICLKHNVFVIADEIHCEFTFENHVYTPFASIKEEFREHCATCISPSKAFNIAGLQIANIVCFNSEILKKIDRAVNVNEVCDVNCLGIEALIAAYNESEDWLTEVNAYIYENYKYLCSYMKENHPNLPLTKLEGTYLAWLDISNLQISSEILVDTLKKDYGVWFNSGKIYGNDNFIRWNLACPRENLQKALMRFSKYVNKKL